MKSFCPCSSFGSLYVVYHKVYDLKLVTHTIYTSPLLHLTTPNYDSKHNNGNNASILFPPSNSIKKNSKYLTTHINLNKIENLSVSCYLPCCTSTAMKKLKSEHTTIKIEKKHNKIITFILLGDKFRYI